MEKDEATFQVLALPQREYVEPLINVVESGGRTITVCQDCNYWLECTGSMRPTISCNNTLTVKLTRRASVGNIVMASPSKKIMRNVFNREDLVFIIHRVINITSDGRYVLKGDANDKPDWYFYQPEDVIGVVTRVDYAE